MSSLAASRADNFYFPPDWRPEYGGISKFAGSSGANQYQKYGIIRFELPFDAWCLKCGTHMCKGLRFNAKKDKAGKYFTTTIWAFTMKCYSCEQQFIVQTNPKDDTYDFVEGLRKMEQDYTPDFDDSLLETTSDETKLKLTTDAMFRLQHENEDKAKAATASERIASLVEVNNEQWKGDYNSNCKLRDIVRGKKRKAAAMLAAGKAVGINVPLLDPTPDDVILAQEMVNESKVIRPSSFRTSERNRLVRIQSESIFKPSSAPPKSLSDPITRTREAMMLRAARNIDPKGMRLQSSKIEPPSNLSPAISNHSQMAEANGTKAAKKLLSSQPLAMVTSAAIDAIPSSLISGGALSMLGDYSDDDE